MIANPSIFSFWQGSWTSIAQEILSLVQSGMRLRTPLDWGVHKESWSRLHDALASDNPEWGLLTAWGILEKEAKQEFGSLLRRPGEGRNASICKNSSDRVGMNSSERSKLKSAMKKRNRAAHGEVTHVDWPDVDIILSAAYRLHRS